MRLTQLAGLVVVPMQLTNGGRSIVLQQVLVDTGSASTAASVDILHSIGLRPEPADVLHEIRGVGGTEIVLPKRVDEVQVGDFRIAGFQIEIGAMDYGFPIDGILGMDFLTQVGAVIDLGAMEIRARDS